MAVNMGEFEGDAKREVAACGLEGIHILERQELLRVIESFEPCLHKHGLHIWASSVRSAVESWMFPGYGNMRNLNVLAVTWLITSVLRVGAGRIRNSLYVAYDDDVWPSVKSHAALVEPLRRLDAACTFGFYGGKPPFPMPLDLDRLRDDRRLYRLVAFSLCMPKGKAVRLLDSIVEMGGQVTFDAESEGGVPCRPAGAHSDESNGLVYTAQYFGGNHAKTWGALVTVPCLPSVDRRADDMLPGMVLSASGTKVAFVGGAVVDHVGRSRENGDFDREMRRVPFAVDLYYVVREVTEQYRRRGQDAFSTWFGENVDDLLDSSDFMSLREHVHSQYRRILDSGPGLALDGVPREEVKRVNDGVLRDYAVLLRGFSSCIEAYLDQT